MVDLLPFTNMYEVMESILIEIKKRSKCLWGRGVQWKIVMQCPESLLKPVIYKVKCSYRLLMTLASAKKDPQNYVYFRFPLKHLQPPKQTFQTLHLIHS